MFKIFHFSKGGPFDSEWLDLPRNTVIKNTFRKKKKKLEKNFGWRGMFKIFHFSKGAQSIQNDLICPERLLWKILFFPKKLGKIFWVMRNVSNFTIFKGGPNRFRMTRFAQKHCHEKYGFFSKKLEKILGGEKCSKFIIFQRGVQSTQNDLICLETLSCKTLFFPKRSLKNFEKFLSQLKMTWFALKHLWKTLFFSKGTWNNFGQWEFFQFILREVQLTWNELICL